jgi:hypothetical protein
MGAGREEEVGAGVEPLLVGVGAEEEQRGCVEHPVARVGAVYWPAIGNFVHHLLHIPPTLIRAPSKLCKGSVKRNLLYVRQKIFSIHR